MIMVSPFGFNPLSNNVFGNAGNAGNAGTAGSGFAGNTQIINSGLPATPGFSQSYLPAASFGLGSQQTMMAMMTMMVQMMMLMMQTLLGGRQPGPQPQPYPQPAPQPAPYPQPAPQPAPQPDVPAPQPEPYPQPEPPAPQPDYPPAPPQPDYPEPEPPAPPQPDYPEPEPPAPPQPDYPEPPPPPPPPAPPYEAKMGTVKGDPHFTGFDGEDYDIQGKAGNLYSILSDKDLAFNARFEQFGKKGKATTMDRTSIQIGDHFVHFNSANGTAKVDGKKLKEGQKVDLGNGQYAMLKNGKLIVKSTEYTITQSVHKNNKNKENWINAEVKTNIDPFADGTNPDGLLGFTLDPEGKKNPLTEADARRYVIR